MGGFNDRFFPCLRIAEIEDLGENDLLFQSTDEGNASTVRIRKSKTDQEGHGALRSLLPAGNLLSPSSACVDWVGTRGWDSESYLPLFPKIRSRVAGVLKLAAISNVVPVGTMSTHSLRDGGATSMFHAGYGLLEVKGWGRWGSSCIHGYLLYDMQTMRHVGKKMSVATGLLDFTKINPSVAKAVTFRESGKETQPQPILHGGILSTAET